MFRQETLFVCGALCEGMVNFEKLRSFVKSVRPATVKGSALRSPVGYPALSLEGEDSVFGQLLELEASETLFALLDEFHGFNSAKAEKSLMLKTKVEVQCGGETLSSQAYVLNPLRPQKGLAPIPQSDWQRDIQDQPPLVDKLTDKQKQYISKLGASSGREIVPIDLELYRQLMSLEIIVDKGRRLALSKLGKDLYKHL